MSSSDVIFVATSNWFKFFLWLIVMSCNILVYGMLGVVSCGLCCAYRGARRGWAELSVTGATVTDSPAAGCQSVAADKA